MKRGPSQIEDSAAVVVDVRLAVAAAGRVVAAVVDAGLAVAVLEDVASLAGKRQEV